LFEWSYEKAGLGIAKKMDHLVVEEAISPLIYKSRRIIYHKRYQGNTAQQNTGKKNLMLS
jgi:hypothetical protein